MCHICDDRYNVHEKAAAHDYYEQMCDYFDLNIKYPKKRKLTKKSLMSKIETQLNKINNENYLDKLRLLLTEQSDLNGLNQKFTSLMVDYYQGKINAD